MIVQSKALDAQSAAIYCYPHISRRRFATVRDSTYFATFPRG
jgi:hypothetical protein